MGAIYVSPRIVAEFHNFSRPNVIINSNFAAHWWRCKHQKYLDTLYVLKLCLTVLDGMLIFSVKIKKDFFPIVLSQDLFSSFLWGLVMFKNVA